ncbi:glutamate racemase [Clostridium sp. SYSU_GA19001]|uniref:glutamate racemase n=1 Tax=Clostridium caldaquaticum TaxID=2940653 RepID=UPI0020779322|nr:glutamate racemase [Clostridium caldaquaticum]MCM8709635.1 glutamate racemase [Clostridium caldaquaticum]
MKNEPNLINNPIGFFDSGVGGLSVLKEAVKLLPNENFIYFGDSKNAPYGTKTVDEVKKLTFNAVDFLLSKEVKAIVIACNTATSAAIEDLRTTYKNIPIIGIEPALKPAVELKKNGKIIIMATPMTLSEAKFNNLMNSYKNEADIEPLPCAGLVELIENGLIEGAEVNSYLKNKLKPYLKSSISSIVLGCTHYPFIKKELSKILDKNTEIIDGSLGTAKQLKRQLSNMNLLNNQATLGKIEIINSLNYKHIIDLSFKLLNS